VTFFDVPASLWRGLIGIEDERFLSHKGVDPIALLRAAYVDLKTLKMAQGGSTITQQITRNLYLGNERSFSRKMKEILFSFFMEYELSKEEILEIYFNEVFWGSLAGIRIHGVYSASMIYFGKVPQDLTSYEVSILIAMLKGPNYYHPLRQTERVQERANLVFNKLKEMKLVGHGEVAWSVQNWKSWKNVLEKSNIDPRLKVAVAHLRKPMSQINPYNEYVYAVAAEQLLSSVKKLPKLKNVELSYKILSANLSCFVEGSECPNPYIFYSKLERNSADAFSLEKHQVGSLLKPLIYRYLVQKGYYFQQEVSTEPVTLSLLSGKWTPKESTKLELPPTITLREALQKSRNNPLIRLAGLAGMSDLELFLEHFQSGVWHKPLEQYPSQLLGAVEMSLEEIMKMYTLFIQEECADLQSEKINELSSPLLVMSHPHETTIAPVVSPFIEDGSFFGKTGTSNNANDNWFVSFDGSLLTLTWIGAEKKDQAISLGLSGAYSSYKVFEHFYLYGGRMHQKMDCKTVALPVYNINSSK
jgi:penicillin-binding protein 1B